MYLMRMETGKVKENIDTKHIKEILTNLESGCFHKGEKEKFFAYSHHTFCDKNATMIFGCHNLKKIALSRRKTIHIVAIFVNFYKIS